jgi:hypothetical protein
MTTQKSNTGQHLAIALALTIVLTTVTTSSALSFTGSLAATIAQSTSAWPPIPKIKKLIPKKVSIVPLDEKNQKLADRVKAALDKYKPVDSYLNEVKVAELEAAGVHLEETQTIISEAKSSLKGMDYKAREHYKVKGLREKLKKVQDYYSTAKSNYRTVMKAEEEKARVKAAAEQFERQKYLEAARRFFQVYEGLHRVMHWAKFSTDEGAKNFKGSIGIYSESDVTKAQALAKRALKACTTPSYVAADKETYLLADALVADKYCTEDRRCTKIAGICEMAKPENFNPALTRAYLRTLNESAAKSTAKVYERIKLIQEGKGYYMRGRDFMNTMRELNGGKWAVNANTDLFVNELKRVEGYFKILGAKMPEGGPFSARNEANKKLGEEVKKQINTCGRWPKDGKYKERHATAAVKKTMGKSQKAIKIGMWQENWKINKNRLGITTSRHKHGYVISRVKGNKYCQLTGFKYVETYIAGGKFQKTGGVGYDGVNKPVTCK